MPAKERFKQLRIKNDYTQKELADLLGINQQGITDIETGKKRIPFEILEILGNKLNINLNWLITGNGKMKDNGITFSHVNEPQESYNTKTTDELTELLRENRQLRIRIEELEKKK